MSARVDDWLKILLVLFLVCIPLRIFGIVPAQPSGWHLLYFLPLCLFSAITLIWLWILCMQHNWNFHTGAPKWIWITCLIFFNWVAAIIYYIVMKRKAEQGR